jgi:hypothetical protein
MKGLMTASHFLRTAISLIFLAAAPLVAGPITPAVTLSTLADTATQIPGGTGTFTSFNPVGEPGDPYRSAGNTVFWGAGIGQQGIYASLFGTLTRIADLTTAIPGVTDKFFTSASAPVIFGGNVAFIGNGDGSQGIYVRFWPQDPIKVVADQTTFRRIP